MYHYIGRMTCIGLAMAATACGAVDDGIELPTDEADAEINAIDPAFHVRATLPDDLFDFHEPLTHVEVRFFEP